MLHKPKLFIVFVDNIWQLKPYGKTEKVFASKQQMIYGIFYIKGLYQLGTFSFMYLFYHRVRIIQTFFFSFTSGNILQNDNYVTHDCLKQQLQHKVTFSSPDVTLTAGETLFQILLIYFQCKFCCGPPIIICIQPLSAKASNKRLQIHSATDHSHL